MAKPRGTDGALLHSLPLTTVAVALSFAPHTPFVPIWITAILLGSSLWRYSVERRRGNLPHPVVRAILALLCFLGVFFTYDTISGVGPGSALLAVMAAMKFLETRRRRDQFVLLFIAIFLTMSALLREQYLWSLPFLVVSLMVTLTAWLQMSADSTAGIRQSAATGSRMLLYAAPVAIAMWIFFPRIATPFWSVPIDTGSAISGLDDQMSPGDISSLSLSNAVAFRVYFKTDPPPQKDLYWRGLILTEFSSRTWSVSDSGTGIGDPPEKQLDVYGEPYYYQVTLEPTRLQWLFALDMPYDWKMNNSFMGHQQQLLSEHPVDQRIRYDVVSFPEYRAGVDIKPRWRARYEHLPPDSNPRTVALAKEMRAAADNDLAFIRNILQMFSEESYFYTLQPPALGRDPVDQFLFDTRQGFCEHYASAFAVMMRAAGIPSRVVLGYQGGEMNGDYMIVRQADAHAWTEVWLEGLGWRRFDPTAAVAPERVDAGRAGAVFEGIGEAWGMSAPSEFVYNLSLTWDSINAKWNELVLGYGPENQERFMEWLGMDNPDWRKMMFTLIGLVAGFVFLISMLMFYRNLPPRPDPAARLYRRFVKRTGLELQTGETPDAFAARAASGSKLCEADIVAVTRAYLAARYDPTNENSLVALQNAVSAARR
ncbi:MAG: DUF3488 and transglutaminase-like domain-containing protein [Woeseiaceae bacterium]|nr:DUF3488 and transglutaminase-like domain-containing protein [Woeseiaceae bacterium]